MKFPIIGGAVFVLSGLGALAALSLSNRGDDVPDTSVVAAASDATQTLVYHVPDMSCDFVCSPTVRKTLAAIPGVTNVETNIEDHTATVIASSDFDESQALAALSKAGYPAERATN